VINSWLAIPLALPAAFVALLDWPKGLIASPIVAFLQDRGAILR
jgi:hypothetical protein